MSDTRSPIASPATDKGPTTEHGPLGHNADSLQDRLITAYYATPDTAQDARAALLQAGVAADAIRITPRARHDPATVEQTRPADDTVLGRLREMILPDELSVAARAAIANDEAILTVTPLRHQVEIVVRIIEATHPTRFDADLERWRNNG